MPEVKPGPTHPPDAGVLLVGHGTRNEQGRRECQRCAALLAERLPQTRIELAFLELAEPTIAEGVRRLAARGARRLLVAPLLLFAAGHAKRDIPREVAAAAARHDLTFDVAGHLGCHPKLLELSARRFREALAGRTPRSAEETALVMVGRGSLDDSAIGEMKKFTELRCRLTPVGRAFTAFLAMAEPRLVQVLAEAESQRDAYEPLAKIPIKRMPIKRMVVQPHLLFTGDLLAECRRLVAQAAESSPALEWIVAGHLEPDPLLVDAFLERIEQCL